MALPGTMKTSSGFNVSAIGTNPNRRSGSKLLQNGPPTSHPDGMLQRLLRSGAQLPTNGTIDISDLGLIKIQSPAKILKIRIRKGKGANSLSPSRRGPVSRKVRKAASRKEALPRTNGGVPCSKFIIN